MGIDVGVGLGAFALVVGFPLTLLVLLLVLGRLESWVLMPDERAERVSRLLDQVDEADELEHAVTLMMADVTPTSRPAPSARARRRWALRLAARRSRAGRTTAGHSA